MVELSEVTDTTLDTTALRDAVGAADAGAVVVFEGVVRDHDPEAAGQVTGLEYTAHPDATKFLREIIAEANTEMHNELDHGPLPVRVAARTGFGTLTVGATALVDDRKAVGRGKRVDSGGGGTIKKTKEVDYHDMQAQW